MQLMFIPPNNYSYILYIYIPFFQPYLLELFAATYLNPIDHHESPTMSAGQKHLSLELIQI